MTPRKPGTPASGAANSARDVRRMIEVVRYAGRNLYRSQIPRMAAALAYRTLFALIPVLVVGLVVLGSFASEEDVQAAVVRLLDFTGISEIAVEPEQIDMDSPSALAQFFGPTPPPLSTIDPNASPEERRRGVGIQLGSAKRIGPTAPAPEDIVTTQVMSEDAAAATERLDEWITELVGRVRTIPFGAIGIVGVAILVYAALSMFVEIERSFNQLYGAREGRAWLTRLTMYWTMLTLGTVFLLASFWVGERFQSWVLYNIESGGSNAAPFVVGGLGFVVTVCISTLLLLLIYTTVPNTKVKVQPALAGAFVAAVLWEAGKWGFTQYLQYSTAYARFYGQIALLPIFMLWIYLTWLIALFGLQVANILQSFERWRAQSAQEREADVEAGSGLEPWGSVLVAAAVARGFEAGDALDASAVAESTSMTRPQADRCLTSLAERGILREIADQDGAYVLARPPALIRAEELLEHSAEPDETTPGGCAVTRARCAALDAFGGCSLADILEEDRHAARSGEANGADEDAGPGSESPTRATPDSPVLGGSEADRTGSSA
ncbi:MAG: YihY family inner membrane protein [Phycisphaerales bacterium]|nr:MAG: YihY family inner membrane protein [Phycisphaerales bacterium]